MPDKAIRYGGPDNVYRDKVNVFDIASSVADKLPREMEIASRNFPEIKEHQKRMADPKDTGYLDEMKNDTNILYNSLNTNDTIKELSKSSGLEKDEVQYILDDKPKQDIMDKKEYSKKLDKWILKVSSLGGEKNKRYLAMYASGTPAEEALNSLRVGATRENTLRNFNEFLKPSSGAEGAPRKTRKQVRAYINRLSEEEKKVLKSPIEHLNDDWEKSDAKKERETRDAEYGVATKSVEDMLLDGDSIAEINSFVDNWGKPSGKNAINGSTLRRYTDSRLKEIEKEKTTKVAALKAKVAAHKSSEAAAKAAVEASGKNARESLKVAITNENKLLNIAKAEEKNETDEAEKAAIRLEIKTRIRTIKNLVGAQPFLSDLISNGEYDSKEIPISGVINSAKANAQDAVRTEDYNKNIDSLNQNSPGDVDASIIPFNNGKSSEKIKKFIKDNPNKGYQLGYAKGPKNKRVNALLDKNGKELGYFDDNKFVVKLKDGRYDDNLQSRVKDVVSKYKGTEGMLNDNWLKIIYDKLVARNGGVAVSAEIYEKSIELTLKKMRENKRNAGE